MTLVRHNRVSAWGRGVAFWCLAFVLPAAAEAGLAERAKSIFSIADAPSREAQLVLALIDAKPDMYREWVRLIDAEPPCAARDHDRRVVVEYWASLEQKAVMDYVQGKALATRRQNALWEAVVRGWTRQAPRVAWSWSRQQLTIDDFDFSRAVVEVLAETAPAEGLSLLVDDARRANAVQDESSEHAERVFAFFRGLIETGDHATGRRLVDDYPPGQVRNRLLFFVAERMGEYDLPATTAWAQGRVGQADAFYALAAVGIHHGDRDVSAALDWLATLKDPALRARIARVVTGAAIDRDASLKTADMILAKLKAPAERQAAFASFARSNPLVKSDPRRILDWAGEIESVEERMPALMRGYGAWFEFDRSSALGHLGAAPRLTPSEKSTIEKFLKSAEEDP